MAKDKRNFKRPLHEACSNIATQTTMNYVVFEDGNIVATDGELIIIQSLYGHGFTESEIDQLEGKALHREVFKEILKYGSITIDEGKIIAKKGRVEVAFKLQSLQDQENCSYVNYKSIVDSPTYSSNVDVCKIGFNLNILARISKLTLNDLGKVAFNFKGESSACIIQGLGCNETILVLPCKTK